jgi:histidine triad (HIT) family protein
MPSVFTRVASGEAPGRIVHADDRCIALLAFTPLRPGHVLVVPREEIDHWLDLPPDLAAHVFATAATIGRAIRRAFPCEKVALVVAGIEVRHAHLHLVPVDRLADLDFGRQQRDPDPAMMDDAAERIRRELTHS